MNLYARTAVRSGGALTPRAGGVEGGEYDFDFDGGPRYIIYCT